MSTVSLSRSHVLQGVRDAQVPRGVSTAHPIFVVRAEGTHVWDVTGKKYLDFTGGLGVMNTGHGHKKVLQAVRAQMERYVHTGFQVAMYEPYVRLAERLNQLAPMGGRNKTVLVTTGAEAVENAVKIAREATGRPAVVSFNGGFHGRTLLGMSLTGKAAPYRQGFGPFAPEIYHAPYPNPYRGWTTQRAVEAFQDMLTFSVAPDKIAAVVIEPVLGEGGFVPAPEEFLRWLRDFTSENGILLVVDEIQTGFGRTGTMFAIEQSNIEPDLIVMAKSLAGGLPLAAVTGRAGLMDAVAPGGLGGTYGGNPLACAAAIAVLDVFKDEDILGRARKLGQQLREGFETLKENFAVIGDVRGLGPMLALEFVTDLASRQPASGLVSRLVSKARDSGLLLLKAGPHQNVIRSLVPLIADQEDVAWALQTLQNLLLDENLSQNGGDALS